MPPFAAGLAVTSNGVAIIANSYDEGHRLFGRYQNGSVLGNVPVNCLHNELGGFAVGTNNTYIYVAAYDTSSSNANDLQRYNMNESPSSFSGAGGACSNQVTVDSGGSGSIQGVAASSTEVYLSDPQAGAIKVYDANSMAFLRQWSVSNPGRIALDSSTSTLWVISGTSVNHYDLNGNLLGSITSVTSPAAVAVQPSTGNVWIADDGSDQNIKIFNSSRTQVGTFGVQGGVYANTEGGAGVVAPDKLWNPIGIGFDGSGNLYVLDRGFTNAMSELRAFNSSGGSLWMLHGYGYVKTAAPDPGTDGQYVYMTSTSYQMNYSGLTTGSTGGGTESSWYGVTVNPFLYPNDPRLKAAFPVISAVQDVGGHTYALMTEMYAKSPLLFRLNGAIWVPMALINAGDAGSYPSQPSGAYLWQDTNGDGNFQSNEYTTISSGGIGFNNEEDWFLDAKGNLWYTTLTNVIGELPMQGIDANGNLTYTASSITTYSVPSPFNLVRRVFYDASTDVMYITGYTPSLPFGNNEPCQTYSAGSVLAAYPHWSQGNRTASWTVNLPWNPQGTSCTPGSTDITPKNIAVAGGKVYVSLFDTPNSSGNWYLVDGAHVTHDIYVYDASTGASLGEIVPGPEVNYWMGWNDCDEVLNAMQRSNGEYLIFDEEEVNGKALLFRGLLDNYTQY